MRTSRMAERASFTCGWQSDGSSDGSSDGNRMAIGWQSDAVSRWQLGWRSGVAIGVSGRLADPSRQSGGDRREVGCLGRAVRGRGAPMASIRSNQKQSEAIRSNRVHVALRSDGFNQKQSEAIRRNQKQSEALRSNKKQSEALRSTPKQSEAFRSTPKHSEALRSTPKHSEAIVSNRKQSEALTSTFDMEADGSAIAFFGCWSLRKVSRP